MTGGLALPFLDQWPICKLVTGLGRHHGAEVYRRQSGSCTCFTSERESLTDRQKHRQKHTERQTQREAEGEKEGQRDRETEMQ